MFKHFNPQLPWISISTFEIFSVLIWLKYFQPAWEPLVVFNLAAMMAANISVIATIFLYRVKIKTNWDEQWTLRYAVIFVFLQKFQFTIYSKFCDFVSLDCNYYTIRIINDKKLAGIPTSFLCCTLHLWQVRGRKAEPVILSSAYIQEVEMVVQMNTKNR